MNHFRVYMIIIRYIKTESTRKFLFYVDKNLEAEQSK